MPETTEPPAISPATLRWFRRIVRRKLRKQFHRIRLLGTPPPPGDAPLVVFMNHPSWWDPMLAMFLAERFFPELEHYGPIDAKALERYRILKKVGLFGVSQGERCGAVEFVNTSLAILSKPASALWITPQGEFCDVRMRPPGFKPGLSHLLKRMPGATALPLAVEYVHWQESTPESLLSFGKPLSLPGDSDTKALNAQLESALAGTQDELSEAAQSRDPSLFGELQGGKAGVGGIYDLWGRIRAGISGVKFEAEHTPLPR